ncbi:transposase domain-containing protein [Dyadobacter tibetensis]
MIYSLFATCKNHNIKPQAWLLVVLRKLNYWN